MEELIYSEETCSEIEHEAMKDFKKALGNIDFVKYNPYSGEFMKALFIGQMWDLIKKLNTCNWCDNNEESEYKDVAEEIDGARKYKELYAVTGDSSYKDMAKDELKHAGILINKHRADADTDEKASALNGFAKEHQKISNELEAVNTAVQVPVV